jgi:hypothetical protein
MHDRVFSLSDDPNCILFIVKLIFRLWDPR